MNHNERPTPTTLPQLKREMKERVESYLREKFSYTTVEKWIEEMFRSNIETLAMSALGFEKDTWSHSWKMKHSYGERDGVQSTIIKMAKGLVETKLPEILKECEEKIVTIALNKKHVNDARGYYKAHFEHLLEEKLKEWAYAKAELDIEKVFAQDDNLLKEIVFEHPILKGVNNDDEDEDPEDDN